MRYLKWFIKASSIGIGLIFLLVFVIAFWDIIPQIQYWFSKPSSEYRTIISNVPNTRGFQKVDFSGIKSVEWDQMIIFGPYQDICDLNLQEFSKEQVNCEFLGDTAYVLLIKDGKLVVRIPADSMVHRKGQEDSPSGKKGAVILFETDGHGNMFQGGLYDKG